MAEATVTQATFGYGNFGTVIGTATLRADAAVTTSYVASSHVDLAVYDVAAVEIALTWVDSTSLQWYVEWSPDGTNFFQQTERSVSGGTVTIANANQTIASGASYKHVVSFTPLARYMRVSVKKTGGVGADSVAITASLIRKVND